MEEEEEEELDEEEGHQDVPELEDQEVAGCYAFLATSSHHAVEQHP